MTIIMTIMMVVMVVMVVMVISETSSQIRYLKRTTLQFRMNLVNNGNFNGNS